MEKKLFSIFITLITIGVLSGQFFATPVLALEASRDPVAVHISPEFPGYNDTVTINLTSYGTDLTRATIIWKENGSTVLTGIGKILFTTKAPATSGSKNIEVDITLLSGQVIIKNIVIAPTEVDLLVESIDGYTHPFYRGRSLPTRESLIKVSAIPQITNKVDSKDVVYTWKQNFKARPDFSGYGKRYFVYKNAFLNPSDTIEVTSSTQSGGSVAMQSKIVNLYTPQIFLYEDHPSEGMLYNRALIGQLDMTTEEKTFVAVPYFSSTNPYGDSQSSALSYDWNINNTRTTPTEKNRITLRKPEGAEGQARLSVEIEHAINTFQSSAETSVLINF